MSVSARIFHSSYRHRHCHHPHPLPPKFILLDVKNTPLRRLFHVTCCARISTTAYHRSFSQQQNHSLSKFLHVPSFNSVPGNHLDLDRLFFGPPKEDDNWNFSAAAAAAARPTLLLNHNNSTAGIVDKEPEVAVVILGWLGAKPNHLRRYVDLYNARGIHAVTFVASVFDVLSFDLGKKLEQRIQNLARYLASWLSNQPGPRFLIFHTFSNTGWLTYGAILDDLKDRQDLLEKIKGCIVDSGGDPIVDPKVWAAGFTTALLKKSSSAIYPSFGTGETQLGNGKEASKIEEKKPLLIETLLLFAFERLFFFLLNLPDVNQRLGKTISVLSKNQPPCPQLYLYSTGDKVIPYRRVESFIEHQGRIGRRVFYFNFGLSPHVDHYRTFPDSYASQLDNFLKECLIMVRK